MSFKKCPKTKAKTKTLVLAIRSTTLACYTISSEINLLKTIESTKLFSNLEVQVVGRVSVSFSPSEELILSPLMVKGIIETRTFMHKIVIIKKWIREM